MRNIIETENGARIVRGCIVALALSTALVSQPVSADQGFTIAVDGETIAGDDKQHVVTVTERQNDADAALEAVDVQVKYDGLGAEPILNVSTQDTRASYRAGSPVVFRASTNYPGFINRSEIRILKATTGSVVETIALSDSNSQTGWVMPATSDPLVYVLRVYDADGRFDETLPLPLNSVENTLERHETVPDGPAVAAGEGEDRTAIRNIAVEGGAVTVYGRNVPERAKVSVRGEDVVIDNSGAFVIQRILPIGEHEVGVNVYNGGQDQLDVSREIVIPASEWFAVGIADLTIGHRFGSDSLVETDEGEFDRTYTRGRLAFYLKGKIKGKYLLTAAADTQEAPIRDLFRNFDAKDPRSFLRRIDPDRYYPVYGDDSTTVEDAPTNGKFYVRLERDSSHIMWGNSKTTIDGNEYARHSRALYGAHGKYVSRSTTAHGAPKITAEGYASQPDTLPRRDRLRGTGGSVYFLSRQDILRGSETITIEVRDPLTGIVSSRRVLKYGEDYEINYVQGVVILSKPLASTAPNSTLVSTNPLGEDAINLVVQYEFTPAIGDVDGTSYGGRVQGWLGDNVRLGATGISETTGDADQRIIGADIHVRLGENSSIEAEIAQSRGPGFGLSQSINGGLTLTENRTAGTNNRALAYGGRLHLDLTDFGYDRGSIKAYYARREAGFSSLDYDTLVTERTFGVLANIPLTDVTDVRLAYEDYSDDNGRKRQEADLEVETKINEYWAVALGAKYAKFRGRNGPSRLNGNRLDVGAKITYTPQLGTTWFLYGQATADRSNGIERNDRIGVGVKHQFTDKLSVEGDVSYGTSGWAGFAGLNYDKTADDRYYVGYRLNPITDAFANTTTLSRRDSGLVAGARHRYNEAVSVYSEVGYDRWGTNPSLTSTYGVEYTPTSAWKAGISAEYGEIFAGFDDSVERFALSASLAYNDPQGISWHLKGEGRFDRSSDDQKDRDTYLFAAGVNVKISPDWRFLGNLDAAISDSQQADILDGDFIEGAIGFAYRPTEDDRFNALFKYAYLYDLPGPDQQNSSGQTLGAAQRSHILTVDASYDINEWLTVGGKYGFRIGEISQDRTEDDFTRSSAHLGVLRADVHVVHKWDVFAEARVLHTKELDTTRTGFVVGVHRHVGENLKVGVGFNFAEFSDDVADINQDDGGVFLNVVGKF